MRFRFRLMVIILIMMNSCNSEKPNQMGSEFVPTHLLKVDFTNSQKFKLSDLFEKIQYIPLESNKETIALDDGFIVLRNKEDKFYVYKDDSDLDYLGVFDQKGKLLNFKNFENAGPGAVLGGNDFWINKDNSIEILDRFQKKIIVFDHTFQYKKDINLPANFSKMIKLKNDHYWLYTNYDFNPERKLFYLVDSVGKILDSKITYPEAFTDLGEKKLNIEWSNQSDSYLFYPHFQQNIYKVDQKGFSLAYTYDFGNEEQIESMLDQFQNTFRHEKNVSRRYRWFDEEENQLIHELHGVTDLKNYLACKVFHEEEQFWILYDKKEERTKCIKKLENDIDFGPINVIAPLSGHYKNNAVVIMIPAIIITQHLDYLDELMVENPNIDYTLNGKNAFYQLKGQVKETDNPVLAIAYFKEDLSKVFEDQ